MKKIYQSTILVLFFFGLSHTVKAQQGFGTNNPNQSAVVDITATSKGLLYPRVNLSSLTGGDITVWGLSGGAGATNGMTVYNTSATAPFSRGLYTWFNSKWNIISTDLRLVGTNNHVTQDAGFGSNGTSLGSQYGNIAIGKDAQSSITGGAYNVAIGEGALKMNDTDENVAVGAFALENNLNGTQNTAIGSYALQANTGALNTAIGFESLSANTTGESNSAFGVNALTTNTVGSENTAIGYYSLQKNTDGLQNAALGAYALRNLGFLGGTGSYNTANGSSSFTNLTNGSNNTAVGNAAGSLLASGDNNTAIGYNTNFANTNGSNQLNIANNIFGTGLTGDVTTPAGNIGIGNPAPSEKLDVTGNVRFSGALMPNNAAGTSGQVLVSAGAGAPPTWANSASALTVPISSLTAAIATNTINNLDFKQTWNWNTLSSGTGLEMNFNSLAAGFGYSIISRNLTTGNALRVNNSTTTSTGDTVHFRSTATGGNVLNVTTSATSGNGISITAPSLTSGNALNVSSAAAFTSAAADILASNASNTGAALRINTATTDGIGLQMQADAMTKGSAFDIAGNNAALSSTNGFFRIRNIATPATANGLFFRVHPTPSGGNGLTIINDGKVGVGTTAPGNSLEVTSASAGTSGVRMTNLTNAVTTSTAGAATLGVNATGDIVVTSTAASTAAKNFIYMPSISIDTSVIANGFTKNLYTLYTGQFTTPQAKSPLAPASVPIFVAATDIYYYITYYDTSVFSNVAVDNSGVMTYNVIGNSTASSFINVVFVPIN